MSTVTAQVDPGSMARLNANIRRLVATGKVQAFELIKSLEYQTAKRAIGTTKAAPRYANKLARKLGGFDARYGGKRMRTGKKKPMQWAFGEASKDGQDYAYGVHPLPFLKKFGRVKKGVKGYKGSGGHVDATWRGSRLKMVSRGFAKAMWIGVLRAIKAKYGQNAHTKGGSAQGMTLYGWSAKKYADAKISKSAVSGNVSGEIVNSAPPIDYLNRRDNLATKAIKQVNHFLRAVLIPEAEAGFEKAWNRKQGA